MCNWFRYRYVLFTTVSYIHYAIFMYTIIITYVWDEFREFTCSWGKVLKSNWLLVQFIVLQITNRLYCSSLTLSVAVYVRFSQLPSPSLPSSSFWCACARSGSPAVDGIPLAWQLEVESRGAAEKHKMAGKERGKERKRGGEGGQQSSNIADHIIYCNVCSCCAHVIFWVVQSSILVTFLWTQY